MKITKEQAGRICALIEDYNAREAVRRESGCAWGVLYRMLRGVYSVRVGGISCACEPGAADTLRVQCQAQRGSLAASDIIGGLLLGAGVVMDADFYTSPHTYAVAELEIIH